MKTFTKTSILLLLVCLFDSSATAQKKTARKASKAQTIVCKMGSVPKGMVIVGHRQNDACSEGMELIVKRPAKLETVCADSPVPDDYTVAGIRGSAACNTPDFNPLTNALSISHVGASPAIDPKNRLGEPGVLSTGKGEFAFERQVEERANQVNAEARLENAATRHEIMVGMTMAQVQRAWGSPASASRTTRSGSGTETIWSYYRKGQSVTVYFGANNLVTDYVMHE